MLAGTLAALVVLVAWVGDAPLVTRAEPAPVDTVLWAGWQLSSARTAGTDGAAISRVDYPPRDWHRVTTMPSTVLQALSDDGTYPNLYQGRNLVTEVPRDLYRQDWWYRTTFTAPVGHGSYELDFPGINYRARVFLNGHLVSGDDALVGMYVDHTVDVTPWIEPGRPNALAVLVTPERALQDVDGVELADSWFDWINWNYLGYDGPGKNPANGNSFVPDRNAGIWKPVTLRAFGAVTVQDAAVTTELPLPRTDSARLTVYADVRNRSDRRVAGEVHVRISRPGTPTLEVDRPVTLGPGERREVAFTPDDVAALRLEHPDLWWPYTMGDPALYDLRVEFRRYGVVTGAHDSRFGVRTVTAGRDDDERFPELGRGGSFYLQVNGRDLLVRGATYTPDLLFRFDPDREDAILSYVRDLGLNLIRLESKIPDEGFFARADELGIPVMAGWMCCNQWEKWGQWDAEDLRVAKDSVRSQAGMLRGHASSFVWANASDGRPPAPVLQAYRSILAELHWPDAIVDTVSSYATDANGERLWDGIQMAGPYSWRPPSYWFDGRYRAARGASAEQGDNEHVPPLETLRRFLPPDRLWPINEDWYVHAGSNPSNASLAGIRRVLDRRYGPSRSAEEFTRKAQLAHYEATRAQFESFAALGWAGHKMTIYWMLNSHWPSFFGNLFDYYLRPGGAYYGAKRGLRPLSAVFDSYATGDHRFANVTLVNQSPRDVAGLRVRVRTYDTGGAVRDDRTSLPLSAAAGATAAALTLPRIARDAPVTFVRCEVLDGAGKVLDENVYWQSRTGDDVGEPNRDFAFDVDQDAYADMTALNSMPAAALDVDATASTDGAGRDAVTVTLRNPTSRIAFFSRAEVTATPDGDEILPIAYDDNYVTVFPHETATVRALVPTPWVRAGWVRVRGYDTPPVLVPVRRVGEDVPVDQRGERR